MWMNMGYWGNATASTTLSEACRDLLEAVLAEAGFSCELEKAEAEKGTRRRRCLIDLGFGCGDQTVYLMSDTPIRLCDRDWWGERNHCVRFNHYIGITKDAVQARYALMRVEEMKYSRKQAFPDVQEGQRPNITLFCADAANSISWSEQLQICIQSARDNSEENWVLALDTAYHFSPSRWPLINHVFLVPLP
jgi:hypothetical protein